MANEVLDPNLLDAKINEPDVVWHDAMSAPFGLYGVYYDGGMSAYRRMPYEIAERVNNGVRYYSACTSGGRLRFATDSPYVAIAARIPGAGIESNMPLSTICGFSLYADGEFCGKVSPTAKEAFASWNGGVSFAGCISLRHRESGIFECELYFPLYGGVRELRVGLADGCRLLSPRPYTHKKPIVFYGSSIFQGAAASRPGNDFAAILSRRLDADYLNLGCSGSGNAEPIMMDYLAAIDAGAYVFDYNFSLSRPERVLPPHYEVYRRLRDAHPDAPIVMIDKPSTRFDRKGYEMRSAMIHATYERAVAEGDRLVRALDAGELLGDGNPDCLADTAHPNDLGFYRMANAIEPLLCDLFAAKK